MPLVNQLIAFGDGHRETGFVMLFQQLQISVHPGLIEALSVGQLGQYKKQREKKSLHRIKSNRI